MQERYQGLLLSLAGIVEAVEATARFIEAADDPTALAAVANCRAGDETRGKRQEPAALKEANCAGTP